MESQKETAHTPEHKTVSDSRTLQAPTTMIIADNELAASEFEKARMEAVTAYEERLK